MSSARTVHSRGLDCMVHGYCSCNACGARLNAWLGQVRKSYEEKRRRRRARGHQRAWKLQRMAVDAADEPAAASGRGRQAARADAPRGEADLERFMEARPQLPMLKLTFVGFRVWQHMRTRRVRRGPGALHGGAHLKCRSFMCCRCCCSAATWWLWWTWTPRK